MSFDGEFPLFSSHTWECPSVIHAPSQCLNGLFTACQLPTIGIVINVYRWIHMKLSTSTRRYLFRRKEKFNIWHKMMNCSLLTLAHNCGMWMERRNSWILSNKSIFHLILSTLITIVQTKRNTLSCAIRNSHRSEKSHIFRSVDFPLEMEISNDRYDAEYSVVELGRDEEIQRVYSVFPQVVQSQTVPVPTQSNDIAETTETPFWGESSMSSHCCR